MSLKTRFGNLRNVLDENSSQSEILVLESPFIANAEFEVLVKRFGDQVAFIDCTFPVTPGHDDLRQGLERIRAEAEDAVRSGAGQLVLTDEHQGAGTRWGCR
jgi:glutamate synthase (NADPH/NADH) large chain